MKETKNERNENFVWKAEEKKEVRNHIEPLNHLPLLRFHPGGVQQELAI
jgi:hypothetical protein